MSLTEYAEALLQDTLSTAEVEGIPRLQAFTQLVMERLESAGELEDTHPAYHRKTGVEVSGWGHDTDRAVLSAFVSDWSGSTPPGSLTATASTQYLKRLVNFIERCSDGYSSRLEESDDVWELADLLAREHRSFTELRLYLFSDSVARAAKHPQAPDSLLGIPVTTHIWDLERLYRLDTSGLEREPISVTVSDFHADPLAVLEGPSGADHRVYLAILPGQLLADLYSTFGSRLLERNVRSFLQARGAVNKGIRETILQDPTRFLAFNNGVSMTAADVSVSESPSGGLAITEIKDLQIVNGGQTTASLHHAATRDKADLSIIGVQAKLTVVRPDVIDEIVPWISKYSNTQNKVTGADFSANHPFHVRVEELSRTVWAPAADGTQKQTRWFYERARGQYTDELTRAGTPPRQRQFKLNSPTSQKFTKTDLAKFLHTWHQLPHLVALGAEKNFREFMLRLEAHPIQPDLEWFQRLIASAILFRSAERIVQKQQFGGYRSQIVTYTLAKLAHATQHRLDLVAIWRAQQLTTQVSTAIAELSHPVHAVITNPSGRVRHVGEWAKKLDCWKAVDELAWDVSPDLNSELLQVARDGPGQRPSGLEAVATPDQTAALAAAESVAAETWLAISHWAKETSNLQAWQRGIAFSVGKLRENGRSPSLKQAVQAVRLYEEALRLGFQP